MPYRGLKRNMVVELLKRHTCGGAMWRVERVGTHEVCLRCETCQRRVTLAHSAARDRIARVVSRENKRVKRPDARTKAARDGWVQMGSTVTVRAEGETADQTYKIARDACLACTPPEITVESPLGQAVLGARVGETRTVTTPGQPVVEVTIIAIQHPALPPKQSLRSTWTDPNYRDPTWYRPVPGGAPGLGKKG